jgi:hypothetical protein
MEKPLFSVTWECAQVSGRDGLDLAASVEKAVETQLSLLHTIPCERVVLEGSPASPHIKH